MAPASVLSNMALPHLGDFDPMVYKELYLIYCPDCAAWEHQSTMVGGLCRTVFLLQLRPEYPQLQHAGLRA